MEFIMLRALVETVWGHTGGRYRIVFQDRTFCDPEVRFGPPKKLNKFRVVLEPYFFWKSSRNWWTREGCHEHPAYRTSKGILSPFSLALIKQEILALYRKSLRAIRTKPEVILPITLTEI